MNDTPCITIELSGIAYSPSELMILLYKDPLIAFIKNGILSNLNKSVEDVICNSSIKNRTFESTYHLSRAIVEELIKNDNSMGEVIPRNIHHFWAGEEMSETAMDNILKWHKKAKKHQWKHFLWIDSVTNSFYYNEGKYMVHLQDAGIEIKDFPQLLLEMSEDIQKAYNMLANKAYSKHKKSLLYMSDLARCTVLYHYGGVYCDVDIDPHKVSLEESLKHRDAESEIPMLGPCFRTEYDAKAAGYLDILPGAKETACLRMYDKRSFGNHFIATRGETNIMEQAVKNIIKSLKTSNYNTTLGPGDIVKAIYNRNNNYGITSTQAIPPWLFDMSWVTPESNNIVF